MTTSMSTRTTPGIVARTTAAAALAAVLSFGLGACGNDDGNDAGGDTATDPDASSSSSSPSDDTSATSEPEPGPGTGETVKAIGSAGVTEATMVHGTDVGGSASTLAFAVDTDQAVADFVDQFDPSFAGAVTAAIGAEAEAAPAPGATPYAATVAVGCEAPRAVAIDAGEAGFEVVPRLPKSTVQCLAPMTYVVVFTVPDA